MGAWDRIAAAVSHPRSWVMALLIAASAAVFMVIVGANTAADKPPLQVPPSAESARAAALLSSFPGEGQSRAILVVSRRDAGRLTPADLAAAESARLHVSSHRAGPPLVVSPDG